MKELIFNVTKVDNGYILSTPDKVKVVVDTRTLLSEIQQILNG